MRNNRNPGANGKAAAIRLISAALLVLILSGCAAMQPNKAPASPLTAPKPVFSPPVPLPEAGPQPASLAPTGSLWAPSSGSLFADLKASKVGDIVTITVSETSAASKASATTNSKAQNFTGSFTFGGVGVGSQCQQPQGRDQYCSL